MQIYKKLCIKYIFLQLFFDGIKKREKRRQHPLSENPISDGLRHPFFQTFLEIGMDVQPALIVKDSLQQIFE